jgi:CDP-paratose synthetase
LKTYLITGATGYLGSCIVKKLVKKNVKVFCLVRNKSNYQCLKKLKNNQKIVIFNYQKKSLNFFFKKNKIDGIIHCATNYGLDNSIINEFINTNLIFPHLVLKYAIKYNVNFFINTDTILNKNVSKYALSKNQFSDWLEFYSSHIRCVNVRLQHFYGPEDNEKRFISNIIKKILKKEKKIDLTKGNQFRDFVYIDDVVTAYLKIISYASKVKNKYLKFDIASGKKYKIKNIVQIISKLLKNNSTVLNFGVLPNRPNETIKINTDLRNNKKIGWKTKYSLLAGLKKTIKFYEKVKD